MRLTIAAGIMIDGKEGDIYNTNLNAGSGTIDNQGTIDADSGGGSGFSITSGSGGSWTNDGTLEATAGGHLNLDGTWTNNPGHMISVTGSTVAFNDTGRTAERSRPSSRLLSFSTRAHTLATFSVHTLATPAAKSIRFLAAA